MGGVRVGSISFEYFGVGISYYVCYYVIVGEVYDIDFFLVVVVLVKSVVDYGDDVICIVVFIVGKIGRVVDILVVVLVWGVRVDEDEVVLVGEWG